MSKEKGDPARSPRKAKQEETTKQAEFVNPSVTFFPQGVMLHKPVRGVKPKDSGGTRSTISGWSSASRRRMREWMLTHEAPQGWATHGVTLTVPGPVLDMPSAKNLWKNFCRKVEEQGWGMVWRIEIQLRGAHHWHAILTQPVRHPADISILWDDCLRQLPPVEHQTAKGQWYYGLRTALPGAYLYACKVESQGDRGAWLRYMQDHASKGKQEQIPEDIGRHWGVVGRKSFVEREGLKADLSDKAYARVVRCMRRLATPIRPNSQSVFGKSLSYSPRRGMRGHSVWYSRPETIARFVDWARKLDLAALDAWEIHRKEN